MKDKESKQVYPPIFIQSKIPLCKAHTSSVVSKYKYHTLQINATSNVLYSTINFLSIVHSKFY